ncbi:MAG: hypothetical protein IKM73_00215 [Acidaminococcaceae bacterium]|nr:hypothetical protein [Acidaminococcaceae bacterium]
MSVYIEGMEMPEDGRYTLCITHDSSGNVHWVFQNEDTYEFLKHGRVEELPPHGRCIDADKIGLTDFEIILCQKGNPFKNALEMLLEKIENAPTIIPASEEG